MSYPDTVVLAILDEPPFCWLETDGTPRGCDVEVATIALRRMGIESVAVRQADFAELIPGLLAGLWHLTTGMFVTGERQRQVRFTRPIWAVPDGFIVRRADAGRFTSYNDLALDVVARLGVVVGQVQGDSARQAGLPDERIARFATQHEAVQAVRHGEVDAAASTAIGNRALLARLRDAELAAIDLGRTGSNPVGAFALSRTQSALADMIDAQLEGFLGSAQHLDIMKRYGFTATSLPPSLI